MLLSGQRSTAPIAKPAACAPPAPITVWWCAPTAKAPGAVGGGRTWVSPPGNLYCSLLARPPIPAPAPLATLTFVAALAVHQLVRAALPAARTVALKWPNDVLVDGAKVSGILLEGQHGGAGPGGNYRGGDQFGQPPGRRALRGDRPAAGGGRLTVDGALTALLGAFGPGTTAGRRRASHRCGRPGWRRPARLARPSPSIRRRAAMVASPALTNRAACSWKPRPAPI